MPWLNWSVSATPIQISGCVLVTFFILIPQSGTTDHKIRLIWQNGKVVCTPRAGAQQRRAPSVRPTIVVNDYGRGRGVGRAFGVGVTRGTGVGVTVGVAVGVGVGVGLAPTGTIA